MDLHEQVELIARMADKLERDHRRMSSDDFGKAVRELVEKIRDLRIHFGT